MANYAILTPGDQIIEIIVPHYSETLDLMVSILGATGSPETVLDLGAGPGRKVGMLLPNIPEYILALQGYHQPLVVIHKSALYQKNMLEFLNHTLSDRWNKMGY